MIGQMKCKNFNSYLMKIIDLSLGFHKSHLILIQTKTCKQQLSLMTSRHLCTGQIKPQLIG